MVIWDYTLDWLSVPLDLSFGTGAHHFPICKICFMERDDFEMKPAPLFAFLVPEFTSRSGKEGPNFSHFGCNSSTLPSRTASIVPHSGKPRSWREKGIAKKGRRREKGWNFFFSRNRFKTRELSSCVDGRRGKSGQLLSRVRGESQENAYFQMNLKAKNRASRKSDAIYAAREYRAGGQRKFESWYPTEITVFR